MVQYFDWDAEARSVANSVGNTTHNLFSGFANAINSVIDRRNARVQHYCNVYNRHLGLLNYYTSYGELLTVRYHTQSWVSAHIQLAIWHFDNYMRNEGTPVDAKEKFDWEREREISKQMLMQCGTYLVEKTNDESLTFEGLAQKAATIDDCYLGRLGTYDQLTKNAADDYTKDKVFLDKIIKSEDGVALAKAYRAIVQKMQPRANECMEAIRVHGALSKIALTYVYAYAGNEECRTMVEIFHKAHCEKNVRSALLQAWAKVAG